MYHTLFPKDFSEVCTVHTAVGFVENTVQYTSVSHFIYLKVINPSFLLNYYIFFLPYCRTLPLQFPDKVPGPFIVHSDPPKGVLGSFVPQILWVFTSLYIFFGNPYFHPSLEFSWLTGAFFIIVYSSFYFTCLHVIS